MQYVIGAVLVVALIYAAIWLAVVIVMFVVVPLAVVLAGLGLLAGAAVGLASFAAALLGRGSPPPRVVTPDDVAGGTSGLPAVAGHAPFGRDRAWAAYPALQWRLDLGAAWIALRGVLRASWDRIRGWPDRTGTPWAWGPVIVFAVPAWLGVCVAALATGVVLTVPFVAVALSAWAVWVVATGGLRGVDLLIRKARRAGGSCPHCYHVTMLPAFPCGGCGALHRDLRPGRLGGWWRRCACGELLPTSVLRASRRLTPKCPRCEEPLREGAAVVTDIRLPVFGPVSAGKTRLVDAGLVALRDDLVAAGVEVDFVEDGSRSVFQDAERLISSGAATPKTLPGVLPHAVTVRLAKGRKRALLHLFDAAGEFYVDREDNSDLEFLDHAQGLVFVVDPFSVPWVRDQLGAGAAVSLASANPATDDPESAYRVTAGRLRDYGVETRRRALALTVAKADLLCDLPPGEHLRSGRVRQWLVDAGLDNLVLSAERDFGEVRYFVVASLPATAAGRALSPAAPFHWLVARSGFDHKPVLPPAEGTP
ncbi:hypothetical protein ACFV4N_24755 [Actinosynnema sp. NPDC059797]